MKLRAADSLLALQTPDVLNLDPTSGDLLQLKLTHIAASVGRYTVHLQEKHVWRRKFRK